MSSAEILCQPAFILQQRHFRETSVLLTVFTRDYGVVTVLGKGVRKPKSKLIGVLLPFTLLHLSYSDKNELKILTQAEYIERFDLQRLALYCGFYLNELVQRLLQLHDPYPELFVRYQQCLRDLLVAPRIQNTLRYFELDLLHSMGYGWCWDENDVSRIDTAHTLQRYRWHADQGLVLDPAGVASARTLAMMQTRSDLHGESLQEAKLLLRQMLEPCLGGRPLKSRQVLASIMSHL